MSDMYPRESGTGMGLGMVLGILLAIVLALLVLFFVFGTNFFGAAGAGTDGGSNNNSPRIEINQPQQPSGGSGGAQQPGGSDPAVPTK